MIKWVSSHKENLFSDARHRITVLSRKLVSKFQTMLGRWWFKMTQKLFFKKLWGKPLNRKDIWKPILLDRRSYFKPLIMLWIYVCNIKRLHHQVAKMRHFFSLFLIKEDRLIKCLVTCARFTQGEWKRREIQLTRPALPYDYTCFADGTPFA